MLAHASALCIMSLRKSTTANSCHLDDSNDPTAFAGACLVRSLLCLQVKQGGTTIGGSAHPATFEAVYDLAGPTYPGDCLAYVQHSVCMHHAST